jgi:hypothetical protein
MGDRSPQEALLQWTFAQSADEVPEPYGRVSAFLLDQFALETTYTGVPHSIGFMVPSGGKRLARHLALSLLIADFAHQKAGSEGERKNGIVEGDVLLVSQKTHSAERLISNYPIGDYSISDFWNVTRGLPDQESGERPQLSVVNPGWIQEKREIPASFYSVIIDGTHPRIIPHLESITEKARTRLKVLVTPALGSYRINSLEESGIDFWLWDEETKDVAASSLNLSEWSFPNPSPSLRVTPVENEEVDFYLEYAHNHLLEMIGEEHSLLARPWILYNYLRRLTVPILDLDKARRELFRTRPISKLLDELPNSVDGSAILETNWPEVVGALQSAYEKLKQYTRPPKQDALIERVQEYLGQDAGPVRIVLPTKHEARLLSTQLSQHIDGLGSAIQDGALQFVRESRRESLTNEGIDIIPGHRTGRFRHLSAIPGSNIDMLALPHEVEASKRVLGSLESGLEATSKSESRESFLTGIGLLPHDTTEVDPATSIQVEISSGASGEGKQAKLSGHTEEEEVTLDEIIPSLNTSHSEIEDAVSNNGNEPRDDRGGQVAIRFEDGSRRSYPPGRMISVWYEEDIRRVSAQDLMVGQRVIVFVDEAYSDLYERFLETISQQRSNNHETALQTWRYLKQEALSGHSSVQELYQSLNAQGLSVEKHAVATWYDTGPNGTIAPRKRDDFAVLVRHAKPDFSDQSIDTLFGFIKSERQTRRNAGRWLKKLLRNAASTQSAPSLDGIEADMAELYDAIDIRTIAELEKPK